MAGIPGGYSTSESNADVEALVKNNTAAINAKLGKHYESFKIDKVHTQVVAGTNYFLHLTSNDGHKVSVTIFVPLPHTGQPAQVVDTHDGHEAPHHHGH